MLKKFVLLSALATIMGTTHAYQAEVTATYDKFEVNDWYADKAIAIDGTYYLKSVDIKNSPLNEASFLDRASNFNAAIFHSDLGYGETTEYDVGVEYFVPNSNFYLNSKVGYQRFKADSDNYLYTGSVFIAEVGYLPVTGLLIAAGLEGYNGSSNYGNDTNAIDPTLRAKYVTTAGKFDVNFEGNLLFSHNTFYDLAADLYLDKTLSIGVAYSGSDMSNDVEDFFTIRAKKFFTPQISVEANAKFGDKVDGYGASVGYRF
ncbi:putative porin [Acinetobacter sp. 194]|uniref:putative porin n=1 Tax=Acinetobacter shaoyimingii TaxID=2715164 RepID=UPI0014098EB5|nr:putative porin [Acinetobacter shaoyimingii]NHB56861.1 putative porin [Acinetobacter shaoyimingii]